MQYTYQPEGVCAQAFCITVEDGVVREVLFKEGCSGNTQGIARLVAGMSVEEVIARLEGIVCKGRGTSCPDQLARAMKQLTANN